jgi:hypothetical protein
MTSLVLGSELALFAGVRSTTSVCRPVLSEVEGLPQVTGPLPSIRRARPLIVACSEERTTPPLHYSLGLLLHRFPCPNSFKME